MVASCKAAPEKQTVLRNEQYKTTYVQGTGAEYRAALCNRKDDMTMTNLEKYINAFAEALEVPAEEVPALVYGESAAWDSVGHMTLIAALEDAFDIMVDMDDIIDLSSFEKGKEILAKYDVEL